MKQCNWTEGLGRATFGRVLMGSLSEETKVSLKGWDGSSHAKSQGKNDFYAKGTDAQALYLGKVQSFQGKKGSKSGWRVENETGEAFEGWNVVGS